MVWRHATPPTARDCGRADPVTLALQWLGIRLGELRALMHVERTGEVGGRSLGALGKAHWRAILACFRVPGENLCALLRSAEGAEWQQRVHTLALTAPGLVLNVDTLWTWASEARSAARCRARAASVSALSSWRVFIDDQLRCGAGVLHRFTKRPTIAACASIIREGSRTLAPQHLVDADCESWRGVWFKFAEESRIALARSAAPGQHAAAGNHWRLLGESGADLQGEDGPGV